MYYYYDIYSNGVFVKSVEDMDYATYYILKNINAYYIIYYYSENKETSIPEGIIKVDNNKVIKIINDKYISTYSPFDHYLFKRSDLSQLYLSFYNDSVVQSNNVVQSNKVLTNNKPTQQLIKNLNVNLNQNNVQEEKKSYENIDINIDDIQAQLNELNELNKVVSELKSKQEEDFLNKDCEERFQKKQKRLEDERLKEKYNIFVSDIGIYNKLINEKHFSESFIPPFFEAKYYIIKYLYKHKYFNDENLNEPSQEIFDLYKIIYDFVNNDFKINKDSEEFIDILEEFEDFLPNDKEIKTDRQIMNNMNGKDKNNDMFVEHTGYENDSDTESDTESDIESDNNNDILSHSSDSSSNTEEEIKQIQNEINIYNKITKTNEIEPDFKNKYEAIKYMFHEGYFDMTDLHDSINDAGKLYYIICEYADKQTNKQEMRKKYEDIVEEFDNFDKIFNN